MNPVLEEIFNSVQLDVNPGPDGVTTLREEGRAMSKGRR